MSTGSITIRVHQHTAGHGRAFLQAGVDEVSWRDSSLARRPVLRTVGRRSGYGVVKRAVCPGAESVESDLPPPEFEAAVIGTRSRKGFLFRTCRDRGIKRRLTPRLKSACVAASSRQDFKL